MKRNYTYLKTLSLLSLLLAGLLMACKDETETLSDNVRVLLVRSGNKVLANNSANVENVGVELELVFSHPLNKQAFEQNLSISGNPSVAISYDETGSFVTLDLGTLAFDTEYVISLPNGNYGVDGEKLINDFEFTFETKAFIPPVLSFTAVSTELQEGESTTITATLASQILFDVSFDIAMGGSAILDTDYTSSVTSIVIPAGQTVSTFDITTLTDADVEGEEQIVINVANLQNAVLSSPLTISLFDKFPSLALKGVLNVRWTTETDLNSGKAIHFKATEDIADLSEYGFGVANNGGGTDGQEYIFPAISVLAGEDIIVARQPAALEAYFGAGCFSEFEHILESVVPNQNGDDAIELFQGGVAVETFGDINVDGTGQPWEYTDSWAYKLGDDWVYGNLGCTVGSTDSRSSNCVYPLCANPLELKGVLASLWNGSGTNGGKAIHLIANRDIPDLSIYGLGVANNGGGTDGIEYVFPAGAANEGDHILVAREPATLATYFGSCYNGYDLVFQSDAMNQNGDDAIELFSGTDVIETFGDINVDGTGQFWDYENTWAFKRGGSWIYSLPNCPAGSTTTQSSNCPYGFCQ